MAFGTELSDFAKAFAATSGQMAGNRPPPHYVSASEVAERNARAAALAEQTRASQATVTPEAVGADIEVKKATAEETRQKAEAARIANRPENIELARQHTQGEIDRWKSASGLDDAQAEVLLDPAKREADRKKTLADAGLSEAQSEAYREQAADLRAKRASSIAETQSQTEERGVKIAKDRQGLVPGRLEAEEMVKNWNSRHPERPFTVEQLMGLPGVGGGTAAPAVEATPAEAPAPAPSGPAVGGPEFIPPDSVEPPARARGGQQSMAEPGVQQASYQPAVPAAGGGGSYGTVMSTAQRPATVTDPHTGQKVSLPTMTPTQAAVWAGNVKQESSGNPNALNKREGAYGSIQWRLERRNNLEAFARANGMPVGDLRTQTLFGRWEMANTESGAGQRFLAAQTPEAANAALKGFIRYGDNSQGTRLANARRFMGGAGSEETTAMTTPEGGDEFDRTGTGTQREVKTGLDAAVVAMSHTYDMADLSGKTAVPDSTDTDRPDRVRGVVEGRGAQDAPTAEKVKDIFSPADGKKTEAQRNYEALYNTYDFYANVLHDPEKAKNAAASLYQYYKKAAGTYGAFAIAAAKKGDLDKATENVVRAYGFIPDGKDLRIQKLENGNYMVSVTTIPEDPRARPKRVHEQIMAPDELASTIAGLPLGQFDPFIAQAAGEKRPSQAYTENLPEKLRGVGSVEEAQSIRQFDRDAQLKAEADRVAAQGPSMDDRQAGEQLASTVVAGWHDSLKDGPRKDLAEKYIPNMNSAVADVMATKPNASTSDIAGTVATLLIPDPAKPDDWEHPETLPFQFTESQVDPSLFDVHVAGVAQPVPMPKQLVAEMILQRRGIADEQAASTKEAAVPAAASARQYQNMTDKVGTAASTFAHHPDVAIGALLKAPGRVSEAIGMGALDLWDRYRGAAAAGMERYRGAPLPPRSP